MLIPGSKSILVIILNLGAPMKQNNIIHFILSFLIIVFTNFADARFLLKINQIESIIPEKTMIDSVKLALGPPDQVVSLEELGRGNDIVWLYIEGEYQATRLSVAFNPITKIVNSLSWFLNDNDAEGDLNKLIAHYPKLNFKPRRGDSNNPHVLSDKIFYEDLKAGVYITYSKTSRRVETIFWNHSQENLAARNPNKVQNKIKFHIGGQP